MEHVTTYLTLTRAAQKLGLPPNTLRNIEARGEVGPFPRDSANRRVLTLADFEAVRRYLTSRSRRHA